MTSETGQDPNPDTVSLVRRYQESGDRVALERLFERFYPRIERIVRIRTGTALLRKVSVEDLVQNTFLRWLKAIDTFQPDGRLINKVCTMAEREIVNAAQYARRDKRDVDREIPIEAIRRGAEESQLGIDLVAESTSLIERMSKKETEEIVDECIGELDEAHREVILLHDYAQADWDFIAKKLQRPSVAAAQQLHRRAWAKLVEKVQRRDI